MATVDDDQSATSPETDVTSLDDSDLQTRLARDRVLLAVAGLTVVAILARLVFLDDRVAHWDEARVGWWILDYMQTGNFEYRPIIHGPFYHHVNKVLFGLIGATDFAMRLLVATLGGLTPLLALGLRQRLRDVEVVALAGFLALNPVLLYYARFMRGDPLVAFFMFAGFVMFVRLVDTGWHGYLFGGVGAVGLAFTAKENALVYLVTWAGALVLLLDHRLLRAKYHEDPWSTIVIESVKTALRAAWEWLHWLLFAAVEFAAIIVFFYAPRSGDPEGLGLYNSLSDPTTFPDVVEAATVGSWQDFYGLWVSGGHQDHAYLPYLIDLLKTLGWGALAVCLLAVVGFVVDRYAEDGPRDLVMFAFYWGFVSILGYPVITDIKAPWAAMHAVVALTIPAAVGLGLLVRWGRDAFQEEDLVSVGITAVLLFVVVGYVIGAALSGVYLSPQSEENQLVQYAQPGDDIQPAIDRMAVATEDNEGTDVVLYGTFFAKAQPNPDTQLSPACARWYNALPLPWYLEKEDATVACARDEMDLQTHQSAQPPVIIARNDSRDAVRRQFPEYYSAKYELRTYGTETVFFFHPDYAQRPERRA